MLSTAISRVFTFPMRSTDRLFAPTGRAKVVFTEPSDPTGAENSPPVLGFTESSVPVSARSKNRCETSASLQAGGEPTSRAGFARQDSASTDGAAPITPSTTKDASVRILNSNEEINPGHWAKPTPGAWFHPQEQTALPGDVALLGTSARNLISARTFRGRRFFAADRQVAARPIASSSEAREASWSRAEAFGGERRPTPDSDAEPEQHDAGARRP